MPVFTFEKISPPAAREPVRPGSVQVSSLQGSAPSAVKKRRGVIVQILDRFAETRARRTLRQEEMRGQEEMREENRAAARRQPKSRG
jgi:hypothetical protein